MSEASEDPALLLTSPQSTSSPTSASRRDESPPPLTLDASSRHADTDHSVVRTHLYVDVPKLSEEKRVKYRPWKSVEEPDESDLDDSSEIQEIEGEYKQGRKLFLYARCKDGVLRRKEDWEFRTSHRELYDDYIRRKLEGKVGKLDPTSVRIAPHHRIFSKTNKMRISATSEDKNYVSDSEPSEDEGEKGDDSDAYEEDYVRRSTRASKRQINKQIRALPYSPRKARTKNGSRADTIEVSEESDESAPRRRSTRNSKTKFYVTNDDSDYQSEDDESSDNEAPRARARSKRPKRQGPKPAYGQIRKVEDLYDSEPETAALREHCDGCEKCHRAPAHVLLKKLAKRTKRKRKNEDEFSEDEEDYFRRFGGWVRCLKCSVAAHWNCLARAQRAEIVKAARARAAAESDAPSNKITDLDATETTGFVCGSCSKGGLCMMCKQIAVKPESKPSESDISDASAARRSIGEEAHDGSTPAAGVKSLLMHQESASELLFRCSLCKRLAHYNHLPIDDEDLTPAEIAQFYQKENAWQCADCASYIFQLDRIIAWRPSHPDAVDPYVQSSENANYKASLPREYLVKWVGRSFRRVEWVPHMWLVPTHWAKLKNFYEKGPRLDINHADKALNRVDGNSAELTIIGTDEGQSRSTSVGIETPATAQVPPPLSDAESRIPTSWQTIDRILDVLIWAPRKANKPRKRSRISKQKIMEQDDSDADASPEARAEYDRALDLGEEPGSDMTETVDEFEKRTGRELGEEHIGRIVWAFIKWDDLPYDESTWDSPPRRGSSGYGDFQRAFKYYLLSRKVIVKKKTANEISEFENRGNWNKAKLGAPDTGEYDVGQEKNLKLMPFQIHGVNWLCRNWFHSQQCILADEMGLGKTVQIITFIGLLHTKMGAFPSLVVVPNSTITNWIREFARWAPGLRVVPFYGEQKSREIIKMYELQHHVVASGTTGAKYHVLVATYEAVTNAKDFNTVFKKNPRWEVLIVDEGQRLKSDSSLIFKRLAELNSHHRIIMTGTPLNNNIRELFNLMSFLDPDKWNDLEALTRQFEELDEERVKDLHERLRPYFLRRVKADVLDLPPKNEVIVPVSMAPLQKEIYKSILSKNLAVLRSLQDVSSAKLNKSAVKTSNLRNMLMQLRKCLQHPYLVADDIEPKGLSPFEAHSKLIDASGKLQLLRLLLPKLKARGHRVLLFSQFVIGLNIIEDFLQGEGYKFLRLDGTTKQADRQKDMDEFNKENSDAFIYLLSTRAGGVGINLWSADTVIIFDPDFNPHQDLQAIARAHRYGQKRSVLVFKLMTKDSAEEKIIQTGKKKLVLDHLIVQKMDNAEDYGEVQSILTFGARALFDEEGAGASRDITYSEVDVDTLIKKVELEGDEEASETPSNAFSFARVWSAQKDDLNELPDKVENDQGDSWAQTLQKIATGQEREKEQEKVGRGARRKAAKVQKYFEDGSPDKFVTKGKKRRKSGRSGSSDDEYNLPQTREASEAPSTVTTFTDTDPEQKRPKLNEDGDDGFGSSLKTTKPRKKKILRIPAKPLSPTMNQGNVEDCGLCFSRHGAGKCFMTENSSNLVEYRKILLQSEEESYDERLRAVRAIDETLSRRGVGHMIAGQPSMPLKSKDSNHEATPLPSNHHVKGKSASTLLRRQEARAAEERGATAERVENIYSAPFMPLKRVPSLQEHAAEKKPRLRMCEICKTPYHLPVNCPIVAEGPNSVAKAIARLTNQAGSTATLTALRSILRKQKAALEGCTDQPGSVQSLASLSNN